MTDAKTARYKRGRDVTYEARSRGALTRELATIEGRTDLPSQCVIDNDKGGECVVSVEVPCPELLRMALLSSHHRAMPNTASRKPRLQGDAGVARIRTLQGVKVV